MIIWQGRGLLAFVVPFFMVLIPQLFIPHKLWVANNYGIIGLASLASAGVIYILGRRWNDPGRVMIDKASGQEFVLRRQDTLFFVPLRVWPAIWTVGGVLLLLRGLLGWGPLFVGAGLSFMVAFIGLVIRTGQGPARATRWPAERDRLVELQGLSRRDQLADLQRLHDAGEITDDEWAARRSAALGLGGGG